MRYRLSQEQPPSSNLFASRHFARDQRAAKARLRGAAMRHGEPQHSRAFSSARGIAEENKRKGLKRRRGYRGGPAEIRTLDPQLARLVLYQLSYRPTINEAADAADTLCPQTLAKPSAPPNARNVARLCLEHLPRQPAHARFAAIGMGIMVGQGRLELPTSRLSGVYSNQLSYWPLRCKSGKIKVSPFSVKVTTPINACFCEQLSYPDILLA